MKLQAKDHEELARILSRIDITVPPRGLGRTSVHTETHTICYLLSTLLEQGRLKFPLVLEKRERPDYLLKQPEMLTGIEITELVHKDLATIVAKENLTSVNGVSSLSHYRPGQNLSPKDFQSILNGEKIQDEGWDGFQYEKEWAQYCYLGVRAKLLKLNNRGFQQYPRNVLSMYIPYSQSHLDISRAMKLLAFGIKELNSSFSISFDEIYIQLSKQIICLERSSYFIYKTNDLWGSRELDCGESISELAETKTSL